MRTHPTRKRLALLVTLAATRSFAQGHDHAMATTEKLGFVHFATSCAPSVAPQFDRAVTLLHSFEFGSAIQGFGSVLAADSTCAMAEWGIALSRWTNPMAIGLRSPASLEPGRGAATPATPLSGRAADRGRPDIGGLRPLYV